MNKPHIIIKNATEHTWNCRGSCYYCRRLKKDKEKIDMKKVFTWDECSVIL